MKIRKAKKEDLRDILRLKNELSSHMIKIFLKDKKRLIIKRGKFIKKINNLSINAKFLLNFLIEKQLTNKKINFSKKNLKKAYDLEKKYVYLEKDNFLDAEKEILKKGFIKEEKENIKLLIPYEEAYLINEKLREDIYVKHLNKKREFKKIKAKKIYLISQEKNKIKGFLEAHVLKLEKGGYAEIWELIVHEKKRKKGIGSELIKKFLDICKNENIDYVTIQTSKQNKAAINLYKKMGFKKSRGYHMYRIPYKI